MKRAIALVVLCCSLLLPLASEAGPGLRLGGTDDPDTFFGGFFYDVPVSQLGSSLLVFQPGFDIGVHEDGDFFTIRGNLDFRFMFPVGRNFSIYPLVGLTGIYYNIDDCDGCDDSEFGLNAGAGMAFDRFNLDLIFGIGDGIPDLTIAFGFLF